MSQLQRHVAVVYTSHRHVSRQCTIALLHKVFELDSSTVGTILVPVIQYFSIDLTDVLRFRTCIHFCIALVDSFPAYATAWLRTTLKGQGSAD